MTTVILLMILIVIAAFFIVANGSELIIKYGLKNNYNIMYMLIAFIIFIVGFVIFLLIKIFKS